MCGTVLLKREERRCSVCQATHTQQTITWWPATSGLCLPLIERGACVVVGLEVCVSVCVCGLVVRSKDKKALCEMSLSAFLLFHSPTQMFATPLHHLSPLTLTDTNHLHPHHPQHPPTTTNKLQGACFTPGTFLLLPPSSSSSSSSSPPSP